MAAWKVIDQAETVSRAGGRSIDAVRVTYQTDDGMIGSVTVPTTDYNGANGVAVVKAAIDKAITGHARIRALSSETPTSSE
jgi:hypothetical protein